MPRAIVKNVIEDGVSTEVRLWSIILQAESVGGIKAGKGVNLLCSRLPEELRSEGSQLYNPPGHEGH